MQSSYKNLDDFLDDVREEVSLNKIVIDLGIYEKRAFIGTNVSCCFHADDKKPSLQIAEKWFKCYACGAKGDIITFICQYYNLDFMEAVHKLAEILNVNIDDLSYKTNTKKDELLREWQNYLQDFENCSIKEVKEMQRIFFPQEIGYDKREGYVVLPITNKTGSVLGFTKRKVDEIADKIWEDRGADENYYPPKWKHSSMSDSLIGQCQNIYNLAKATQGIRKSKRVIITEGPKDVIAFERCSIFECVASCGTKNITNIWNLLFPLDEIILCLDGDGPGIQSTIDVIIYLTTIFDIKRIKVILLPKDKDPYDVVTADKDGKEKLLKYLEDSVPAIEYFVNNATLKEIKELIKETPEYNYMYVIKSICNIKGMSLKEAEIWIESKDKESEFSEKEILLSIVKGGVEPGSEQLVTPEKAIKILKMKYGIEI